MIILGRSFYERDTVVVARELLGKLLVNKVNGKSVSGIIVETEAYSGTDDPASHAYRGKTKRNAPMFGSVGYSYVYFIYGNHFCFNIVAKARNQKAGAVLIRAIEPIEGIDIMIKNRHQKEIYRLTNGPGKLTQALGISQDHNTQDITRLGLIYIVDQDIDKNYTIIATSRIGIHSATEKPWRFCLADNQYISQ